MTKISWKCQALRFNAYMYISFIRKQAPTYQQWKGYQHGIVEHSAHCGWYRQTSLDGGTWYRSWYLVLGRVDEGVLGVAYDQEEHGLQERDPDPPYTYDPGRSWEGTGNSWALQARRNRILAVLAHSAVWHYYRWADTARWGPGPSRYT